MTQADGVTAAAGSTSSGGQQSTPSADARKASSEAIAAAATAVVAEAITTANREAGRRRTVDSMDKELAASTAATSKVEGHTGAAPGDDAKVCGSGGTQTDGQLDASPRLVRPDGDLRASFLAAVGNTISQTVRACTAESSTIRFSYPFPHTTEVRCNA